MLSTEGSWNSLPKWKCSPFADVWPTNVKLSRCHSSVPICMLCCPETKTFGLRLSALSACFILQGRNLRSSDALAKHRTHSGAASPSSPARVCLVPCFFQAPSWGPAGGRRSPESIPGHSQAPELHVVLVTCSAEPGALGLRSIVSIEGDCVHTAWVCSSSPKFTGVTHDWLSPCR